MTIDVIHGDCLTVMRTLEANSIDAIVTDPPYHLTSGKTGGGFMGKQWDGGDIAFDPVTWTAMLRVLKPGGHLVAFAAPRNQHRMICAIEDAGFEVRDCLMWIFGQGFPKHASALKPAYEPICLARKPLSESSIAANVLRWGCGALNIGACRIDPGSSVRGGGNGTAHRGGIMGEQVSGGRSLVEPHGLGRWPANLVHDGSDEVLAGFPERTVNPPSTKASGGSDLIYGDGWPRKPPHSFDQHGSAARFFYAAKASKADRAGSRHPTCKPLALMRWLCRMVTPPGGLILDPFAGSGTTLAAAREEGFSAIGIEREAEYVADINRRLAKPPDPQPSLDLADPPPSQAAFL